MMRSFMPLAAYIDPGTGSMLFTLLLGLSSAAYFLVRTLVIRIKYLFAGGAAKTSEVRIPYVIFSEGRQYWTVFKPVCDEFEKRGVDVEYWTADEQDPALASSYEHVACKYIGAGNRAWACLNTMSADICLATTPGLEVYQWKRSKGVSWYVHILHATTTAAWYRMFGLDWFDAVLLSNEYQVNEIRELETKRHENPKELFVVGCTYMDAMAKRFAKEVDIPSSGNDCITVLLAPTWGKAGLLARYGKRIISSLVATGYHVIIRPHPQSMKTECEMIKSLMSQYPEGIDVEWNFDADNYSCLRRADVLVSDISGIIHDFALVFNRPVLYSTTTIEPDAYDAAWLDEPFWDTPLFTNVGVPLADEDFDDLAKAIRHVLNDPNVATRRARARELSWAYQGECSSRVVDYLLNKRASIVESRSAKERSNG